MLDSHPTRYCSQESRKKNDLYWVLKTFVELLGQFFVDLHPPNQFYSVSIFLKECIKISDPRSKRQLHQDLVSAAESGWDFSSRWFSREQGTNLTLDTIRTTNILPVDLNSILCMNEHILSLFFNMTGTILSKSVIVVQHICQCCKPYLQWDVKPQTNKQNSVISLKYLNIRNIFLVYVSLLFLGSAINL